VGVPGVVEHGLFIGIATTLLIAGPGEVEVIEKNS
jgi:ribose 5-phosphate isomerase